MKKSRFSEEKIISTVNEIEGGVKATELARKNGVSEATIYNWRARYGGIEVSQLRRLKEREGENVRGQRVGIREIEEKIWLVSFMHCDLGFFDHETGRVECADNPFQAKVLPMPSE